MMGLFFRLFGVCDIGPALAAMADADQSQRRKEAVMRLLKRRAKCPTAEEIKDLVGAPLRLAFASHTPPPVDMAVILAKLGEVP